MAPPPTVSTVSTASPVVREISGPASEFSIMVPDGWNTQTDNYPGRLVFSSEVGGFDFGRKDGEFAYMRVARLKLPALLKSANYVPRADDSTCGMWESVAMGDVTAATVASWMMQAVQKSMEVQIGRPLGLNTSVTEARITTSGSNSGGSELVWRAAVSLPAVLPGSGETAQGTAGRVVPLGDLASRPAAGATLGPRTVVGKALLRDGTVTLSVVDAPAVRFAAGYDGPAPGPYLEQLVQSLSLLRTVTIR